jgi:hypothetical protein
MPCRVSWAFCGVRDAIAVNEHRLASMFEIEWTLPGRKRKTEVGFSTLVSHWQTPIMCGQVRTEFLRGINEFGIFESLCPGCFKVVSLQAHESDLAADETAHLCKDLILKETLDYFRSHLAADSRNAKQQPNSVPLWDRVRHRAGRPS